MRRVKSFIGLGILLTLILLGGVGGSIANTASPQSPVKVIFIHHSVGGNWLADPNPDAPYGGLGRVLMENNYFLSATNYGWGPNSIGDRTDIPNWPEWFTGSASATILKALYTEDSQQIGDFGAWPQRADDPGGENEIIMMKSCYPNSDLYGAPNDPPASETNEQHTVGNAKAIYNTLLTYFASRQDKLFILITPPPQNQNDYSDDYQSPSHRAANARAVNNWLISDWLSGYPYGNVVVFDYFNILTGENNHHRYVNGLIEHVVAENHNFSSYPSGEWDSHPNSAGQQKATAEFVPLLNYYYHQWKNSGGEEPVTQLAMPVADIKIDGSDEELTVNISEEISVSVALNSGTYTGGNADWFLVHFTPDGGLHSFNLETFSFSSHGLGPFFQAGLMDFPAVFLGTLSGLDTGTHTFCFGVDRVMNGALDIETLSVDCIAIMVTKQSDPSGDVTKRLVPDGFRYRGAFRLPEELNWGAQGLSYSPDGNGGAGSLFVTGQQAPIDASGAVCYEESTGCQVHFAEIAIPTPQSSTDWESLPAAEFLHPMTPFDNGLLHHLSSYSFVSGIAYVPRQGSQTSDKIYASLNAWYAEGVFGENTFPTVWFSELDGTDPRGLFHVGNDISPYHGRKMGDYLFTVPQWYADQYLGGRILVTGRSRGTPLEGENGSVAGGSQGPTLFAFHPFQTETPQGNLDALPMIYYRSKYPGCAGPDIGVGGAPVDCDYPGFTMCDAWTGASFVENGENSAILISGIKGTTNCYYCGDPMDDSECHQDPLPGECDLLCNESRGYHCGPYERQIIFYDPDAVGQAAQGQSDPWRVLPYTTWRPQEFYLGDAQGHTCADVGGMAADNTGRRLFVIERGFGGFQNENAAVIHVWKY
ncbi:MAG: hypothetical protein HQK66_00010 [Desulfamplus sp.]|nr:hypothetical protein [Desulfamplus sp.]